MHWSKPAAERTLEALRHLGGSATTREIAQETDSLAVHSDISSLRCYFEQEMGWSSEDVQCEFSHRTDRGKMVYVYTLSHRAMFGEERQAVLFSPEGSDE